MANNTEVIEIEIVLDDGKVQKGFLDLGKASQVLGKGLNKEVGGALKETTALSEEALGGMTRALGAFKAAGAAAGVVLGGLAAAYAYISKVSEASKIADEIKSINTQFEILSARSGASAAVLQESFRVAANGLVDLDDVLKASNMALGSLDISAESLAKTFEIARMASKAFGVDTLQAYEALNNAVLSGNTRGLRQLGIFIDGAEAAKVYGKEIGVAANFLNEAGKQQAIFNAINQKADSVYAGVTSQQEKNSTAAKQLSVSVHELSEATSILIDKTSGKAVSNVNSFFVGIVDGITKIINPPAAPKTAEEALIRIQQETAELTKKLADSKQFVDENRNSINSMSSSYQIAAQHVKQYTQWIAENNEAEEKLIERMMHKKQAISILEGAEAESLEARRARSVQTEALHQRQMQLDAERLQMEIANSQVREQNAVTSLAKETEINLQKQLIEDQHQLALQTLKKQYEDAGLLGTEAYRSAQQATNEKYNQMQLAAEKRKNDSLIAMTRVVQAGIVGTMVQGFTALGKALATGEGGFQAFSKAVIGAMGGLAIQMGTVLVGIGLGFAALGPIMPIWGLSGTAAVIAGLALITVGAGIQAMAGGGSEGGGAVASSGGGSGGGGGVAIAGEAPNMERAEPNTKIDVNIAGNVMDRRQTGLELVEIIKEQFDTQGGQAIVGIS